MYVGKTDVVVVGVYGVGVLEAGIALEVFFRIIFVDACGEIVAALKLDDDEFLLLKRFLPR